MPRVCTITAHPQRDAIDAALLAGQSLRDIARQYRVGKDAIARYRNERMPVPLAVAKKSAEVARGVSVLEQIRVLATDAQRIGNRAEAEGDLRTALMGVRELVRIVELQAKLSGELDERPQVNLVIAPEWLTVRGAIFAALHYASRGPSSRGGGIGCLRGGVMSLAADLAAALDPATFATGAGLIPDPWQAGVLRSSASRMLLNCSRQSGKSTITGVLAVHTALYEPGALVLLLSPSLRQSGELFRKCLDTYRAARRPVLAASESALRLELDNGSRIVSLPGTEGSIRGFSKVRLLIVDEAARVDDGLYYSVRPMLAVGAGRLVAMSTPFGKRGWWHHAWTGDEAWQRVEVPAHMCPRIPVAFLDEERRALGPWWYRQEYECQFSDTTDSLFGSDEVRAAITSDITPLFGGVA